MSKNLTALLSQKIFIPQEFREWEMTYLPVSIRLWNVFKYFDYQKLGDLNGKTYKNIFNGKNCGRKTIFELRGFINELQSAESVAHLSNLINTKKLNKKEKRTPETLYIPQEVRGLPISSFPLSTRLTNNLRDLDFRLLGDLHGFPAVKLKTIRNCGKRTILELKEFVEKIQKGEFETKSTASEFVLTPQELDLAQFIEYIDSFLNELSPRDQEILSLRFAGKSEEPLTLEEIGGKYEITRERVRQIQNNTLKKLTYRLGEAGEDFFDRISRDCFAAVCPLTPQLLIYWAKKSVSDLQFSPQFYVRVLAELAPDVPTLAESQINQKQARNKRSSKICLEIRDLLSRTSKSISLAKLFEQLKKSIGDLQKKELFEALQSANFLALDFELPDKPVIKLTAKRKSSEFAYQVLSESDCPLTPEEIIERAKDKFGTKTITASAHSLANLPFYFEEFYLLDSRAIGLRKHFSLPENRWEELRNDFFNLLKKNNRPFSTTEVVSEKMFDWAEQVNAGEAAQILREDERFTDLRRFHFALAEWEIEERGFLRDLFIEILKRTGHPLTAAEILEQAQKSRSVAATSLPTVLTQTEEIQGFGFGFYGLKIWGNKSHDFLLSNSTFINRFISRSKPPLTFGDLCRKLEIAETGNSADKLWQNVRTLPRVKVKPKDNIPETILVHINWRFERAIQKVLAQDEQPLSIYEIQWELNKMFDTTFDDKKLDSIKTCLQNNEMFVRDPNGAFMLNEQIDLTEFDAEWLQYACLEILKEENAMLSADDLLEKLETKDISDENISSEMLAVILSCNTRFKEI